MTMPMEPLVKLANDFSQELDVLRPVAFKARTDARLN